MLATDGVFDVLGNQAADPTHAGGFWGGGGGWGLGAAGLSVSTWVQ